MPAGGKAHCDRDIGVGIHGDDEHALPRLWHEQQSIGHDRASAVAALLDRVRDRVEVLAAMRRDESADVLQNDHPRRSPLGAKSQHEFTERPERAGAGGIEPGAIAGE
jgi:hypothetical protein